MRRQSLLFGAAVLVWLVAPSWSSAQGTGTVRGQVVSGSGGGVAGARISVVGTGRGGVSNAAGQYLVLDVPAGRHTVRVRSPGFEPAEATVTVPAGGMVTRSFRLAEAATALEEVAVTVGSRARHAAADELAVPVDVYTRAQIRSATPQLEMASVLQELSPAIHFPRPQLADITSGIRPFQLRALSPDHSLVLINGKRRHPTAAVHVFGAGAMGSGSSGVDMNAIVPSAVGGMEILRDGAAAQYGSDAIAGVINVQLRDDVHAPELTASVGGYTPDEFDRDGRRIEVAGSWGIALGDRGSLVLAGMYSDRERTDRAGPDPRDQIRPGDADVIEDIDGDGIGEVVEKNNPVPQPSHLLGDGLAENGGGFYNISYALGDDRLHHAYSFGGFTVRRDVHSGFYRRGLDDRNWPQLHPLGFLPKFRADTKDHMFVLGLRGLLGAWSYDVSGQWDGNHVDLDIFDSHNVSLGPCLDRPCAPGEDGILGTADDPGIPNKTDMFAGALELNQLVGQLDLAREVEIGAATPLNIALGATVRADHFRIGAGEAASWINGWHPNRAGDFAPPGSQLFAGFRPDQAVDEWRTNVGVYADLETDVTEWLLLAGAARFERYSDFGETLTGKLAVRLQPAEPLILRGSVSTGFRAPGLNQSFYAHVSTGFREDPDDPDNRVPYEIGEIPVESPQAVALGAEPLREETSLGISAGIAVSPAENLTFTADGFWIEVDDRIILTGALSGPTVEALLAELGAPTVKFFTNAVDTRARGIDLTARYRHLLDDDAYLELMAQLNATQLDVTDSRVPDVIAEIEDQVFDSGDRFTLENGRPDYRTVLRARYHNGRLRVGGSGNWYGVQTFRLREDPDVFLDDGPHFVVDADLGYRVGGGAELAVGVENLFDANPAVRPDGNDFLGIFPFFTASGLSVNGRYVYARVKLDTGGF